MAKKKSNKPSIFRFICMRDRNTKNYHLDFNTKEEALAYIDELNDPKIEWYGLYEINPDVDYMKSVTQKRLIPHDDRIPISRKDTDSNDSKKRKARKNKTLG